MLKYVVLFGVFFFLQVVFGKYCNKEDWQNLLWDPLTGVFLRKSENRRTEKDLL